MPQPAGDARLKRSDADRHDRVFERRLIFVDRDVRDAVLLEHAREACKLSWRGREDHGMGAFGRRAERGTLAGSVADLGSKQSDREVGSNDDEVLVG